MIKTTFYMVLQPLRRGYDGKVEGIDVDRILKTKPPKLGVRDIAVLVHLEVDERMFVTPAPEVTIRLDDERSLIVPKAEVEVPEDGGTDDDAADDPVPGDAGAVSSRR